MQENNENPVEKVLTELEKEEKNYYIWDRNLREIREGIYKEGVTRPIIEAENKEQYCINMLEKISKRIENLKQA